MNTKNDTYYLEQALLEAVRYRGFCAPNPAVGAVVVINDEIVARGAHTSAGNPHAEVEALKDFTGNLSQATLYVTLEPCCHQGRTPPCTELILQKKISHVVFSELDPNPQVAGQGQQLLQQAGIACEHLPLPAITDFYRSYRYWWKTKKPFVTYKIAMTRHGAIANHDGSPLQITGSECAEYTHQQRRRADAILTTVKTIINDDPQLNARCDDEIIAKPLYVLDRQARLPLNARVFTTAVSVTVFHSIGAPRERIARLKEQGCLCIEIPSDKAGLDLLEALKVIGDQGVHDLWVEAGKICLLSFIKENLTNRLLIYLGHQQLSFRQNNQKQIWQYGSGIPVDINWIKLGKDNVLELL